MPFELSPFYSDLAAGALAGVVSGLVTGPVRLAHKKLWDHQKKEERTRIRTIVNVVSRLEELIVAGRQLE